MTIQTHSMFRGNADKIHANLIKNGIAGQVRNKDIRMEFKYLPVDQLVSLETQRETSGNWAEKRLNDLTGFDMLACGALSVAYDESDDIYYVFNGCGRLAQAQINQAPHELPCLIYHIPKARAAFYFSYTQDKGRRNLSKEVIFVNAVYSGDPESLKLAEILEDIECYIKGQTDYAVPHPQIYGHPEIKVRALEDGYKIARGNIDLMKLARDMIWRAWANTAEGCPQLRSDVFCGLLTFFKIFPEATTGSINKALQNFLNWYATGTKQSKVSWKHKGGNQHNKENLCVAYGLYKDFRESQFYKQNYSHTIQEQRFNEYIQIDSLDLSDQLLIKLMEQKKPVGNNAKVDDILAMIRDRQQEKV